MLLQAQLNAQQQQQIAALASVSQSNSVVSSPPSQIKPEDLSAFSADPLQVTQQFIQENRALRNAQQTSSSVQVTTQNNNPNFNGSQLPLHGSTSAPDFSDQWPPSSESHKSNETQNISRKVRGLQQQVLAVQMGRISANSSFNKGTNPDKPLAHAHSFSDSNMLSKEEYANLVSQTRTSIYYLKLLLT